jgi:putative SOS response-associated peptidase YedK
MCGRFTLRAAASVIAEQFALFDALELEPRYNIAPSQPLAAVRLSPQGQRELAWLRWGLVPRWAKEPSIGNRLINARAETVAAKPAFRDAFRHRRCLVVADGFFEWQGSGRGKQPYFIHRRDDRPFAFAALWESWSPAEGSSLETCTLITGEPNAVTRPIHDRMPVILAPDDYARWLDPQQPVEELQSLLAPFAAEAMEAWPVSPLVNSPANDDPRCIERQRELF